MYITLQNSSVVCNFVTFCNVLSFCYKLIGPFNQKAYHSHRNDRLLTIIYVLLILSDISEYLLFQDNLNRDDRSIFQDNNALTTIHNYKYKIV